jgi:hypothetical protein
VQPLPGQFDGLREIDRIVHAEAGDRAHDRYSYGGRGALKLAQPSG